MCAEYDDHHRIGRLVACEGNSVAGWDLGRVGAIGRAGDEAAGLIGESGLVLDPLWTFADSHDENTSVSHVELAPGGCVSCCEGGLVNVWSFQSSAAGAQEALS
jgi:hypothetical protein